MSLLLVDTASRCPQWTQLGVCIQYYSLLWRTVQWVLTMLRAIKPPLRYHKERFHCLGQSLFCSLSLWLAFSRMYYKWKYMLCSFLNLTSSLRKPYLRFIHVAQISSLFSTVCLYRHLCIHSPVRHLVVSVVS